MVDDDSMFQMWLSGSDWWWLRSPSPEPNTPTLRQFQMILWWRDGSQPPGAGLGNIKKKISWRLRQDKRQEMETELEKQMNPTFYFSFYEREKPGKKMNRIHEEIIIQIQFTDWNLVRAKQETLQTYQVGNSISKTSKREHYQTNYIIMLTLFLIYLE